MIWQLLRLFTLYYCRGCSLMFFGPGLVADKQNRPQIETGFYFTLSYAARFLLTSFVEVISAAAFVAEFFKLFVAITVTVIVCVIVVAFVF